MEGEHLCWRVSAGHRSPVSARVLRIVLADDHEVMRKGLRALLEKAPRYQVVGEASDGLETLDLVDRERPDVLVTDLALPGLPGLEVVRRVAHRQPRVGIVVLSMHSSEPHVLEALKNGARGYVPKGAPAAELLKAIDEAAEERRYLSPPLAHDVIEGYLRGGVPAGQALPDSYAQLTNREREVLQLVAEGLKTAAVAERLGISARTVETHRANLTAKLRLRGQGELVRYAVTHGLVGRVDPPSSAEPGAPPGSEAPPGEDSAKTTDPRRRTP
jgi:two-component system response regulator NreC